MARRAGSQPARMGLTAVPHPRARLSRASAPRPRAGGGRRGSQACRPRPRFPLWSAGAQRADGHLRRRAGRLCRCRQMRVRGTPARARSQRHPPRTLRRRCPRGSSGQCGGRSKRGPSAMARDRRCRRVCLPRDLRPLPGAPDRRRTLPAAPPAALAKPSRSPWARDTCTRPAAAVERAPRKGQAAAGVWQTPHLWSCLQPA
mmetsp:Transcript_26847/g.63698  ORF Transcript_26847/g.63698 Transcript_26847/m.63698 type:complete len:202 (+) Transcript_26847:4205-4810(+)